MSYETPRASDGTTLCAWCGGPVRQSGVGRTREYCKQGCRELAYRERRQQKRIAEAVAAAVAPLVSSTDDRPVSSTDDRAPRPNSSVDETGAVQVTPAIPAPAPVPDPPAVVPAVTPVTPAPRAARRRSGMTASAIPLSSRADGVRPGLDPQGWLRAVDAYGGRQQQGSLFEEDQEQVNDGSNPPTNGA